MTGKNIRKLVLAALLAALTAVATMIIRIPTPTQGYIHLGDGMVLICGILLGPGLGALAAGIGSMMADLIGGYMAWVPGTFAIKALTALLGGWLYHRIAGKGMNTIIRVVLCGIPAEIIMVLGYFVYKVLSILVRLRDYAVSCQDKSCLSTERLKLVAEVTDDNGHVRRLAKENIRFTLEGYVLSGFRNPLY